MNTSLEQYHTLLTKLAARVENECGFKNGAWIITFLLLLIDMDTWTIDKSYLAKIYQAIDLIEKDEELKLSFQNIDNK